MYVHSSTATDCIPTFISACKLMRYLCLLSTDPTPLPTPLDAGITETAAAEVVPNPTEGPKEELTVFTNPPPTEAAAAASEEVAPTELVPSAAPPDPVNTDEPVAETVAPVEVATVAPAEPEPEPEPEVHITEAPAVETAAPTDTAVIEDQPVATADAKIEGEDSAGQDVVVEDGIDGEKCVERVQG